ncbi:MAG: hypothetical protein ABI844_12070 [Saprospiraceae bacterium]
MATKKKDLPNVITIEDCAINPQHPDQSWVKLNDGGKSFVAPGKKVKWVVNPKMESGLVITSILIEDDSYSDVFSPDPSPVSPGNPKNLDWEATVNSNLKEGGVENYTIYFTIGGFTYSYDPKIQVNTEE